MTAFTIHASKDGETSQTVRLGPTISVAKARELAKYVRFDRKPPIKF